jgi:hypothetical protein
MPEILGMADPGLNEAAHMSRQGSLAHLHILRNTATTLPAILALPPGMGV